MWRIPAVERLEQWRRFRETLNELPFDVAALETARFWQNAPFTPYYLDYDRPDTWPDPWTLIAENYYCDLAKALGIVYTLHLSNHKDIEISLRILKHTQTRFFYNLVWINDGKYVLNLEPGEIVNKKSIPEELTLVIEYNSTELNLDRY